MFHRDQHPYLIVSFSKPIALSTSEVELSKCADVATDGADDRVTSGYSSDEDTLVEPNSSTVSFESPASQNSKIKRIMGEHRTRRRGIVTMLGVSLLILLIYVTRQLSPPDVFSPFSTPELTSEPPALDTSRLAVMIEKRNLPHLVPSVLSFLNNLPESWAFQLWYGEENRATLFMSEELREHVDNGRLTFVKFPEEEYSINGGAELSLFLTKPWFWEQLAPAEYIFFVQSDSTICSRTNRTIEDFLGFDQYEAGYDWVGAPWGWMNYPSAPFGGNGGFSLRRRSRMLEMTTRFESEWPPQFPEDLWFAYKLEMTSNMFPTTEVALQFSFESPPPFFIDKDWVYEPFGVHIGGGRSWGLCPGRLQFWGSEQVKKLLAWCPEAEPLIPDECLPYDKEWVNTEPCCS